MSDPRHQIAYRPRQLILPQTGDDYAEPRDVIRPVALPDRMDYELVGPTPEDVERLFWFRWIAGHQVSFILWRTIGDVLRSHSDNVPTPRQLVALTACVDGYSAMLLYSATVPRDHYHAQLRVRMATHHPSFSGSWASDYRPLRRLFRGRVRWFGKPSCAALREAVELNRRTHDHIADLLVPDGRSLLQMYAGSAEASVSQEKEELFDSFFMVVRRPVSRAEVIAQLNSRVAEIATDLASNGFYPKIDGGHLPEVHDSAPDRMRALTTDVLRVLCNAALLADEIGRPLEGVH